MSSAASASSRAMAAISRSAWSRQSLFCDDGLPHHIPQRLLTIVHAPFDRVAALVESSDILRRLWFGKGWVQLIVIDPETARARRWREDGCRLQRRLEPYRYRLLKQEI